MSHDKITLGDIACAVLVIVLAALALYPVVSSSVHTTSAPPIKNRARGIWVAVMSANAEREILLEEPCLLWPTDLEAHLGKPFESAEAYFTYLMSDGESGIITYNPEKRVAGDLKPSMLIAPGLVAATGSSLPSNANAWHVICGGTNAPLETPFLITRNVKASDIRYATEEELKQLEDRDNNWGPPLHMDKNTKPFGDTRATWVTKSGGTMDARKIMLRHPLVSPVPQPDGEPELRVLPSIGGYR